MPDNVIDFTSMSTEQSQRVLRWRNHESVRMWMLDSRIIAAEEHARFLDGLRQDRSRRYWLVDSLGVVSISRISSLHRHGFLGIYASPEDQARGSGSILLTAVLNLAFGEIALHTLKAEVIANNARAISLYERHGFKREGVFRDFIRTESGYVDYVLMGITENEFLNRP